MEIKAMNECNPKTPAQAERYLAVLAALAPPASLLEVRYRIAGEMARFFLDIHAPDRARRIVRIGQRTDVYVGCAPRIRRSGRREALAPTALVWVDCDTPEATSALRAFTPAPNMIVTSGTPQHAHGYWALAQTLSTARIEHLNRCLAAKLGADTGAVTAPTAILRIPGTRSFKGNSPRPVRLRRCGGRRYSPPEIEAAAASALSNENDQLARVAPRPAVGRAYRERIAADPLLEIPPAQYIAVLIGRHPGPDHKVACPFHEDPKPSLHVYPTAEQGWTCFGCKTSNGKRLGGDIYKFASLLWGIPTSGASFFELRELLDQLFGMTREY